MKKKAITIWQPYASLIAFGEKRYETRAWGTSLRGMIGIHAASKRFVRGTYEHQILERIKRGSYVLCDLPLEELPYGAMVGTAYLVDCILIDQAFRATLTEREIELGDFRDGRYAWRLTGAEPLIEPIPMKGAQGLWDWKG